MGGFPEWRARHLACAERGRAWLSCWRTTTHLSEERTGCSNEDREVQIALNEWIRRCWFPLKGVPPLLFNWGRGSLWYTAVEAIVEACRQINCKRLPSHTGQEQACTRFTRLFVCSSPCRKWPNNGCCLPPSDHIQSKILFQTKQDQERGMNGPASLLHSWHWVFFCDTLPAVRWG